MKIAILGTAHPYRGGLAAYNERLAQHLQSEGHEVVIYTFSLQYPNFLFPGKTQYSTEAAPSDLKIIRNVNAINPFNWLKVGRQLNQIKYELIITRYWLPFMGPCLGTILRQSKRNKSTKVISILDNIIPHEARIGDTLFTKYFVPPIDAFLAMSSTVMKDLAQFDQKKPRILSPHPLFDNFGKIDSQENARNHLGLEAQTKYILFFGLIRAYKGLDLLLEAMAEDSLKKSQIKLIIAGEYYEDKGKYQTLIKKLNIQDRILSIEKFIPNSEVCHYFNAADLVVQPYKSATQSGVTQIAYHFNKAMIVTNVGGLEEMCPDEKVGYVVKPDPKAIANAIQRYFRETDIPNMIENIKKEKQKYSWKILGDNIFKLYKQL